MGNRGHEPVTVQIGTEPLGRVYGRALQAEVKRKHNRFLVPFAILLLQPGLGNFVRSSSLSLVILGRSGRGSQRCPAEIIKLNPFRKVAL